MKKKIITMCLVAALAATAIVGGTLAYFTDTDSKTNVFTAGNLEIVQNEKDRNGQDYGDGEKELFPIVNDYKDENGYHMGENYIDKIVTVTNKGSEDAYVRTYLAIPAALDNGPSTYDASKNILHWNAASANYEAKAAGDDNEWYWGKDFENDWPGTGQPWNGFQSEIEGVLYNVYVATHKTVLENGETTAPSLLGVYLDKNVDSTTENDKTTYTINGEVINFDIATAKVLVATEAVQAQGFTDLNNNDSAADDALNEAFGGIGTYCPFGGRVKTTF